MLCIHSHFSFLCQKFQIPEDEIASPAELAKAYMSSRSSNVFHSALRLQSRVHLKDKGMPSSAVHATKPSGLLFASSSTVQFSRLPESGYVTPRPRGRSAIYKMAQSPHFKVQSISVKFLCS